MADLDRIVRLKAVLARAGLSRPTLDREGGEGAYTCQCPISVHGAGSHEAAINRWVRCPSSNTWLFGFLAFDGRTCLAAPSTQT